jgi:hypothetical protein
VLKPAVVAHRRMLYTIIPRASLYQRCVSMNPSHPNVETTTVSNNNKQVPVPAVYSLCQEMQPVWGLVYVMEPCGVASLRIPRCLQIIKARNAMTAFEHWRAFRGL